MHSFRTKSILKSPASSGVPDTTQHNRQRKKADLERSAKKATATYQVSWLAKMAKWKKTYKLLYL